MVYLVPPGRANRRPTTLCIVAAAAALCGCAASQTTHSEIASQWLFQPPRGWLEVRNPSGPFGLPAMPGVREWRSPNTTDLISLHVMPSRRPGRLRSVLDPYFTTYSGISGCRGLPALFGQEHSPFGRITSDEVAMEQRGSIAIASYYYSRFSRPSASAKKSLRTLCPKERRRKNGN